MGHAIQAILGHRTMLDPIKARFPIARIVPLCAGIAAIRMSEELFDAINGFSREPKGSESSGFMLLLPSVERLLQDFSTSGGIAYIETDYFGGVGKQSAAAWKDKRIVSGPETNAHVGPINRALAAIGVRKGSSHDEFDAVGLGRFRHMDDFARD